VNCDRHAYSDPSCRSCCVAAGWPYPLTVDELPELRTRIVKGERVDLSGLTHHDKLALRPFMQRPRTDQRPAPLAAPFEDKPSVACDALSQIAARLEAAVKGAPLENAREFLRRGDVNVLANLLTPADFSIVMEMRAADAAPVARAKSEQLAAPIPPSPAQIERDIRDRAARGEGVNDIAAATGQTRFRVQAIIDSSTK